MLPRWSAAALGALVVPLAAAQDLVSSAGYVGLYALIVAENLFPPIPSEVILPFAGFQVAHGQLTYLGTLAAATLGSLTGALILYALARRGGRPLLLRHRRLLRLDEQQLDRAEASFRHGTWFLLGARVVPGLRRIISLPAGLANMPLLRFSALTVLGSAIWNAVLMCRPGAGQQLPPHRRHHRPRLADHLDRTHRRDHRRHRAPLPQNLSDPSTTCRHRCRRRNARRRHVEH